MLKSPRIIYFIAGAVATELERKEAAKLGNNVVMRNSSLIRDDEPLEECDGVAGAVPNSYQSKLKKDVAIVSPNKPATVATAITPPITPPAPPAAPLQQGDAGWWDNDTDNNQAK